MPLAIFDEAIEMFAIFAALAGAGVVGVVVLKSIIDYFCEPRK